MAYVSQSISGYNDTPPGDDGSAVSTNQVKWSFVKDKIGDPVKDLAENINTAVVNAFDQLFLGSSTDKAATFSVSATNDDGKLFNMTAVATVNLPAAADAGNGFTVTILNNSSATITIDGDSSETINGTTTVTLTRDLDGYILVCNGSAWHGFLIQGTPFDINSLSDVTVTASDEFAYADVDDSNNHKKDTVQGIIDLVPGTLIDIQYFTSSGTWTKPSGTNSAYVEVIGGGGGGGGSNSTNNTGGGGGGAGGYAQEHITSGLGASETVTIGAAGAAGSSTGAGGAGGNTTFGAHITGNGGSGGDAGSGTAAGGAGGTASGGDINLTGGAGSGGSFVLGGRSGDGASTPYGSGGLGVLAEGAGNAGSGYGSGGGGGKRTSSSQSGGAGVAGFVKVMSFT